MPTKRIVIRYTSGLRQIIGHMEVLDDDQCPPAFDNVQLGDSIGSVKHIATRPRYITYGEVA